VRRACVSRAKVRATVARCGDHSSRSRLAARLQQPTRGLLSTIVGCQAGPQQCCVPTRHPPSAEGAHSLARNCSASRAGSPLLFGLAPRGVFRASDIANGAVGSYPTFSPLPNEAAFRADARIFSKTSRRFPCAMPPCCAAGGIFSVALSVTEPHRVELNPTPPVQLFG